MGEKILFCKGGGCMAKLGPGALLRVLDLIPKGPRDEKLLIGYESKDDGAVYQVSEDVAIVQTLDFFPPMVEDPYLFGKIAAANALSDVYAMGGAETVIEGGGSLVGGHSIVDESVKYGLSVTGLVHPKQIFPNNQGKPGDLLILTKKLGTGIICTASRIGEASETARKEAVTSMTTLNRKASQICRQYPIHACTDVTGFGFLGHLHEMLDGRYSCQVYAKEVPVIEGVLGYADEFFLTAAGQRNRNHMEPFVRFESVTFAMEETLLDPQTSGGLLIAVSPKAAPELLKELQNEGLPAAIVGQILPKEKVEIRVMGEKQS